MASQRTVATLALVLVTLVAASIAAPPPWQTPFECPRANEHWECGSPCQTKCATLGEPCQIANAICNSACFCDNGFARDNNNNCIAQSECSAI